MSTLSSHPRPQLAFPCTTLLWLFHVPGRLQEYTAGLVCKRLTTDGHSRLLLTGVESLPHDLAAGWLDVCLGVVAWGRAGLL